MAFTCVTLTWFQVLYAYISLVHSQVPAMCQSISGFSGELVSLRVIHKEHVTHMHTWTHTQKI